MSFLYDKHLFSGDVLFKLSVGRTDLLGGDNNTLLDSIQDKLFLLDDDVIVYSGHGAKTTIGFERENNPYV
ncbi:putative metallo-hydrolase [compost metagenome]